METIYKLPDCGEVIELGEHPIYSLLEYSSEDLIYMIENDIILGFEHSEDECYYTDLENFNEENEDVENCDDMEELFELVESNDWTIIDLENGAFIILK